MSLSQQSDGRQLSITDFFAPSIKRKKPSSEEKKAAIITSMDVTEKTNAGIGNSSIERLPDRSLQNGNGIEENCNNATEPMVSAPSLDDVINKDTSSQT